MNHIRQSARERAMFEADLFNAGKHIFTSKNDLLNDALNSLVLHQIVSKRNPLNLVYIENYLYYHTLYHTLIKLIK